MNRNTERIARTAAELEETLAGLTVMLALLPLPGESETGHGGENRLARQMGRRTQLTEGLRAVDGAIAGTSLERDEGGWRGSDWTAAANGGRREPAASGGGTSDPGLYREARALRRLSERILRT